MDDDAQLPHLLLEPGPARVLVVEDEPKLAALLADYLRVAGHEAECVADGHAALRAWAERRHDLVLLDLMLPGLDGLSLCRALRAITAVPIVMLTARADEADRLAGLELGADDYIAKNPFSPREVMARVKAVLRRTRSAQRPQRVDAPAVPPPAPLPALPSPLQVDDKGWRAAWLGRDLDLTPIEFRLLSTLAAQPGRVYPRAQLLDLLHGDARPATERAVDSHVKNLRRKLDQAGAGSERIRSVYGVGYCYQACDRA
ncbi:response regulator [Pseudaquabacterium pictum]|uniref:DNA-binding response regulator n=1 Tax=Pseudaquabacterium pictum TaxID=2315236 RepID=A0A480AXQ7_9BURK|nr:response regulator [Rubrivivax pictus]GCL66101.1 DNA-binding response regulator [Rubrivivax pictus]